MLSNKEAPFFISMNDLPNDIVGYLSQPENLIIASCFVVGRIAKGIPKVPDYLIPVIVAIAGFIQGIYFIGGGKGAIYGFVYSSIATYGHQMLKQILERLDTPTVTTTKPDSETKP